jgi:hypothetical protein
MQLTFTEAISTFPDLKLRVSATNTSGAKSFGQLAILLTRRFVNPKNIYKNGK